MQKNVSDTSIKKTTKKRLRVAIIAPPWLSMPIEGYGGLELVLESLIDSLKSRDDIDLEIIANGERKIKGVKTHSLYKKDQWDLLEKPYYEALPTLQAHIQFALNIIEEGKFDIIHDHNPYIGTELLSLATRIKDMPPALHTFHGPPFHTQAMLEQGEYENILQYKQLKNMGGLYGVCISEAMAKEAPTELKRHMLAAVYNAVEVSNFPFVEKKKDYFLTLARFTSDKGQHIAAKYAAKQKKRLRMAGTVAGITNGRKLLLELSNPLSGYRNHPHFKYYSDKVLPYVLRHPKITYAGNLSGKKKMKYLSEAKALLFPIQWEEPFGMSVIEALACGTPVVAMNRGAMPEIIEHGVTGFLADTEEEFAEYMKRVDEIDPVVCRQSVEQRFSADAMADEYVQRYREVIALSKAAKK